MGLHSLIDFLIMLIVQNSWDTECIIYKAKDLIILPVSPATSQVTAIRILRYSFSSPLGLGSVLSGSAAPAGPLTVPLERLGGYSDSWLVHAENTPVC